MSVQNQLKGMTALMGAALALAGCTDSQDVDEKGTGSVQQPSLTFNGQAWNGGVIWNGQAWNGQAWNGQAWNGLGWNGQAWNGIGWNGQAWNGQAWNGQAWNGQAWNGQAWNGQAWNGQAWNGVPGQDAPTFTALHNWLNHSDTNGNGIPQAAYLDHCGPGNTYSPAYLNDSDDLNARLGALSTWVNCACSPTTAIPFNDTHGRVSTTFYGNLGLAPTWCGSDTSATVPESEIQIVSACLMARINMKGKHYPLSLRSLEASTATTTNEAWVTGRPLARYWGNLWSAPYLDNDNTTPVSADLTQSGGPWWNLNRFSCSLTPAYTAPLISDQYAFGRDCEVGTCGNHLEYLGTCWNVWGSLSPKVLGNQGQWDSNSNNSYYQGGDATYSQNLVAGGIAFTSGNGGGGSNVATATYRNHNPNNAPDPSKHDNFGWRVIEVFGAHTITVEDPKLTAPARNAGQSFAPFVWTQVESFDARGTSTIPNTQSNYCSTFTQSECQSSGTGNGRKLFGLTSNQDISINMSGNFNPGSSFVGDADEPLSLAIRYSRPTQLGPGQCDADIGCAATPWWECNSSSVSTNGCVGGTASPGLLNIWTTNKQRSNFWQLVQGTGSAYAKNLFPPTYSDTTYSTAYIYPIYMQNTSSTVVGWTDLNTSDPNKVDTLRTWLRGTSGSAGDAPNIDAAYYFPGPPPPDANCQGPNGCWLFTGPSYGSATTVAVGQSQQWNYTSPKLPPGSYTFTMIPNGAVDTDLYVKVNGTASLSNWDCRPYYGAGATETCTVTVGGHGGTISVMINGFSAGTSQATYYSSVNDNPPLTLSQSQQWNYTTPRLPPGQYTFAINPSASSDVDLYVKVNGTPTLTSWDCRPYAGTGYAETCTVNLPGNGGTIGVMINGYSAGTSTTAFVARN